MELETTTNWYYPKEYIIFNKAIVSKSKRWHMSHKEWYFHGKNRNVSNAYLSMSVGQMHSCFGWLYDGRKPGCWVVGLWGPLCYSGVSRYRPCPISACRLLQSSRALFTWHDGRALICFWCLSTLHKPGLKSLFNLVYVSFGKFALIFWKWSELWDIFWVIITWFVAFTPPTFLTTRLTLDLKGGNTLKSPQTYENRNLKNPTESKRNNNISHL